MTDPRITLGTDWSLVIDWKDQGGPVDLTGRTTTATVSHRGDVIAAVVEIIDAVAGKFRVSLDETQTARLRTGRVNTLAITSTMGDEEKTLPRQRIIGIAADRAPAIPAAAPEALSVITPGVQGPPGPPGPPGDADAFEVPDLVALYEAALAD